MIRVSDEVLKNVPLTLLVFFIPGLRLAQLLTMFES